MAAGRQGTQEIFDQVERNLHMTRIILITVIACTFSSSANAQEAQKGWLLFRGDPGRTGAASTLPKWPKRSAWERPLLMDEAVDRDGIKQADPDGAVDELLSELRKD